MRDLQTKVPRVVRSGGGAGLLLIAFLWVGCRSAQPPPAPYEAAVPPAVITFRAVTDSLPPEEALEALVAPYRARMAEQTDAVIGVSAQPLTKGDPEGPLGQFAADAMLVVGADYASEPLDIALTNDGGLRVPIPAGPITLGLMYELMPFENRLAVLTLSGTHVDSLAQQLARRGGEPIAGLSFTLLADSQRAVDVEVGGEPLQPDQTYRLVTSDYLASGGGHMPALWDPLARIDLPVLLRDTFTEYVQRQDTLRVSFVPRIHVVEDESYLR